MTWEQQIQTPFIIQTGDGRKYEVLWRGAEKEKEYNTSSFEFINVYGTLVDRKQPQGGKFNLVFWFQGADNIEQADNFETSCDDPRQWTITHPFYGTLKGQPLSIKRDDSSLNITEITVPFWESISPNYPFVNFSKKDNTMNQHTKCFHVLLESATSTKFTPLDIQKQQLNLSKFGAELDKVQDSSTYADFQNALNSGLKAIDNLLANPINAIQTVQNFLDLPATYEQALKGRVASYENIYWRLKDSIETVTDKKYFEGMAGTVLSVISAALVNPIFGDYVTVSDVENMLGRLRVLHNDYKQTLDLLSVDIYDVNNAYVPNAEAQLELDTLIIYVISNLYQFSLGTKRERIVVTKKDTNIILLTHRYLGLDEEDANIDKMIKLNDIRFNELFSIKKGREIKYLK